MFMKRWKMFTAARKNMLFRDGLERGDRWSLKVSDDDPYKWSGHVETRGRVVKVEVIFPRDFPWTEPRFRFPNLDVTHPCVDAETGDMTRLWAHGHWAPGAANPEMIMRTLLLVLDRHDIRGKGPVQ
jgi:ubiquitin-protein ligase